MLAWCLAFRLQPTIVRSCIGDGTHCERSDWCRREGMAVDVIGKFADIAFTISPFAPARLIENWKEILHLWLLGLIGDGCPRGRIATRQSSLSSKPLYTTCRGRWRQYECEPLLTKMSFQKSQSCQIIPVHMLSPP